VLGRSFAKTMLGIGLAAACSLWPTGLPASNLRKTVPNFTLPESTGALVRLSDYKGKVVILDFWATWCLWCEIEIPLYMEFQNKYKDRGLSVIGVSMDEDGWKSVRPFLREKRITYTVVLGDEDVAKLYGLEALPMTLLIDRDGKIAGSYQGLMDKDAFEREIQGLLQGSAQNTTK
jgi:peroxiredoxin